MKFIEALELAKAGKTVRRKSKPHFIQVQIDKDDGGFPAMFRTTVSDIRHYEAYYYPDLRDLEADDWEEAEIPPTPERPKCPTCNREFQA